MRKILCAVLLVALATPALGQVRVRGHFRSDGTYVQPHVRSAPNSSRFDNWSTSPNVNPYNGRQGTVNPFNSYQPRSYSPPVYTPPVYSPPPAPRGSRYSSGACAFGSYC